MTDSTTLDDQFGLWRGRFRALSEQVDWLLQATETFWQFGEYLGENGRRVNHAAWAYFKGWCGATWMVSTAARIRGLGDRDRDTHSLRSLLERVRDNPRVFSRDRYLKMTYATEPVIVERSNAEFTHIAGPGPFIDPGIVEKDIERHDAALAPIKEFVDKRVAHLDPGWEEQEMQGNPINSALAVLREIVERYTPLFTGELLSGHYGHLRQFYVRQIFELDDSNQR